MPERSHTSGGIISYLEMCQAWSASLQKGMNFHSRPNRSVILMSRRSNVPYRDRIKQDSRVSTYEGHDLPPPYGQVQVKAFDQPRESPGGKLTQNGLFEQAALRFKNGAGGPEAVAIFERSRDGIWAFNGMFGLSDAWIEQGSKRKVFKFRLEIALETDGPSVKSAGCARLLTHHSVNCKS
jgi:hypothetical protein